jgi:Cu/Zn superoxide dismutase
MLQICLKYLSATFTYIWNIFTNNSNKLYCLCTDSYTANKTITLQHTHGGPQDEIRHAGDFGNIWAYENGTASDHIQGTLISLCPESEDYAVGRAFVVHAGRDDLGKGGNAESLKTGNAGGRLACCVVVAVN